MKNDTCTGFLLGRASRSTTETPRFGFSSHKPADDCKSENQLIRYAGDASLITIAPTGMGKSSGPVISNLLDHPGTVICLDVKGKIYEATARHRERMGQEIHVLDLRDGDRGTGSLNPFDIARRLGSEVSSTCRSFAAEIVSRSVLDRDSFWTSWSETMITAGLAYLWQHLPEEDCRLSKLHDIYTGEDMTYAIAVLLDNTTAMNKTTLAGWVPYMQLSERDTRPSVMASTIEHLRLYESERIRKLTDTTSIDLDALVAGKPMTIYITAPPYRLAAYSSVIRLWLSGLMNLLSTRETEPEHRTLMLVDEAGQLGRMESFVTASTLMREYGLTLWTIWQNAAQLEIYGPHVRTLIDNAGVVQCFGIRNARMAQEIATLLGGVSGEDLLGMAADEQVLAIAGTRPQVVRQIRYYQEEWLTQQHSIGR